MQVAEAMTRNVRMTNPEQSIAEAAKLMAESDIGVLPVQENDRLVGMITDRDIVVRGVAQGKTNETKVREVMSAEVKYCFEDDDLDDVARNMADLQVRRLPVLNRDKRLTGIVALGDIATNKTDAAGEGLSGISQPSSEAGRRAH